MASSTSLCSLRASWSSSLPSSSSLATIGYTTSSSMVVWTLSSVQICSTTLGSRVFWYCANSFSTLRWSCSNIVTASAMTPPRSVGGACAASYPSGQEEERPEEKGQDDEVEED